MAGTLLENALNANKTTIYCHQVRPNMRRRKFVVRQRHNSSKLKFGKVKVFKNVRAVKTKLSIVLSVT